MNDMTDKELDEALALEVMGWHEGDTRCYDIINRHFFERGFYFQDSGALVMPVNEWNPTKDKNQAFEVLSKCIDRKRNAVIHYNIDINYASIYEYGARGAIGESKGKNLARAICEAVLTAKRGKE